MAAHYATVTWRSDGAFESGKYSRRHEWSFDGGVVVPGSSSPHVVPVPMSDPSAVDPEEALVAAASSCHLLSFLWVAHQAGFVVESYSDAAEGVMGKDERGKIAVTAIKLRPAIRFSGREPSREELDRLHHEAHEACFIASSLRTDVTVEPPRG